METAVWPLWMCLKTEQLVALVAFQWKQYGQKLELLTNPELESLDEIDRIIRKPPASRRSLGG